jgi:hypothetical protein
MNVFSYHILPIIHAYNVGISWLLSYARLRLYARLWSKDATQVRRYDSGRISRLRSHFPTPVNITAPVISPDSDSTSRLWSMSMSHVLPPQLWKTSHVRARWLQHLTAHTLSWKQTGRDAWLVQPSKPHHLMVLHVQESGHVSRDQWTLSPAWYERNPSI